MNESHAGKEPGRPGRPGKAWLVVGAALLLLAALAFLPREKKAGKTKRPVVVEKDPSYAIPSQRRSYFKLESNGSLELRDGLPFRGEGLYDLERTIVPRRTAVIVMDPWVDTPSGELNAEHGRIADHRLLPLVRQALSLEHPVLVLTNRPSPDKSHSSVHPGLAELAEEGALRILYHDDFDDDAFAVLLRGERIDTLIYTGFASNMCVIGRRTGMIPMIHHGFRMFFVPEASAAIEWEESGDDNATHEATTRIISQWIAEILRFDDFMMVRLPDE